MQWLGYLANDSVFSDTGLEEELRTYTALHPPASIIYPNRRCPLSYPLPDRADPLWARTASTQKACSSACWLLHCSAACVALASS